MQSKAKVNQKHHVSAFLVLAIGSAKVFAGGVHWT